MSKPWECPRCFRIWGPTVAACSHCNANPVQTPRRDNAQPAARPSRQRRERAPGANLHDMLYTPTINEFEDGSWKHDDDFDGDIDE